MGAIHNSEANLKINDLCDPNCQWNFDELYFPLPSSLVQVIKEIPHSFNSSQQDSPIWLPSSNGRFLTSSAYNIALNFELKHPIPITTNWKWLWKIFTLPHVVSHLWLTYHDGLPTRYLLAKHNIVTNASCPLCDAHQESTLHILRDCNLHSPLHPLEKHFPHHCLDNLESP